jgi:hypothetical protein
MRYVLVEGDRLAVGINARNILTVTLPKYATAQFASEASVPLPKRGFTALCRLRFDLIDRSLIRLSFVDAATCEDIRRPCPGHIPQGGLRVASFGR